MNNKIENIKKLGQFLLVEKQAATAKNGSHYFRVSDSEDESPRPVFKSKAIQESNTSLDRNAFRDTMVAKITYKDKDGKKQQILKLIREQVVLNLKEHGWG